MLCAVFSDSHGDIISLEKSINASRKYGKIDYCFYLGDGLNDFLYATRKLKLKDESKVIYVKGNNDYLNLFD